ncbi:hypothetical protein ATANTOWER_016208 [Ataeniobius toweri]|uniref:C2H2-type domain-containing protein n=1 Tax=Ataeniobius toweri TaxID=208326 RepID=A0ABU7BJ01_9TELE|nr:hypothetical protein [Ataeniobius toweri]
MCSVQPLREFIRERLTAAAEEIFSQVEKTIVQYEEEIDRQRRLLDLTWRPRTGQNPADLQQHFLCSKKDVLIEQLISNQERISELDQEEPEHLQIKEEPEDLCTSQGQVQIFLKEEADTFLAIPTFEESACSELEPNRDQILSENTLEAEDHDHEETSRTEELKPKHHCLKTSEQREEETPDTDQNEHFCKLCTKRFTQKRYLTKHQRVHSGGKPFICPTCGKSLKNKLSLVVHMRSHTGEKPFPCGTCGRRFAHQISLSLHMRVHSGEKPYECRVCGRCFLTSSNLTCHLRTHTGEKPFSCATCGRSFSQRDNLKRHVKIHRGEKLFSCVTCEKRFYQKSQLTAHLKTHSSDRPFPCDICGKGFCDSHDLSTHMRIHTGEKPFQCLTCGKRFSQRGNLTIHTRTHTALTAAPDRMHVRPAGKASVTATTCPLT